MPDLQKGLIGHWTMNSADTDGSTIRDRSAYDNHGTLNGEITTSNQGIIGESFFFDGNDDNISIPAESIPTGTEITVSLWVYGGPDLPKKTSILRAKKGGSRTINIHLPWNDGTVYWDAGDGSGSYDRISKTADSSDFKGRWTHWVFLKDANAGVMEIYLDGELWKNGSGYSMELAVPDSAVIGSKINGGNEYNGDISDLRVYNRALSQSEINQLYNFRGNSRKSQTTVVAGDSLQAWYPFLQSGAADKSGNGNDGTVNGATYNESGGPEGLGGYEFDGTSDYIDISSVDTFSSNSEWTAVVWFNSNDITKHVHFTGVSSEDSNGWTPLSHFGIRNSTITWWDSDGGWRDGSTNLNSDQWYFGTIVGKSGSVETFINGESEYFETSNIDNNIGRVENIGRRQHNNDRYFVGNLSGIRFFNRALSQSEINQLYDPKSVNLNRGLVGHWSMDDSDVSGGTLYDRSAYDHHGNISGPTTGKNSIIGNSFEFDGSNDTVIIGTDSTLQNQKITAAGWAKADSWSSRDEVFNWDGGGFHVATVNSGVPRFWLNLDGGWGYIDGPSSVSTNTWHMFTGTWDGNEQAIWLNGEKLNSRTDRSGTIPYPTSGDRLSIGGYDSNSNVFDGLISNVRLYKRKLTEKEVKTLYNKRTTTSTNSPSIITESFESGSTVSSLSENWTVGNGNISSSRQYTGSNSFGSWGDGSVDARWDVFPSGQAQIDEFEYYWKEDSGQTGHQVRLYDSNDNLVQRSETENPQWQLSDGSNNMDTLASPGYNTWTLFNFEFDWAAGTYDYYLEDEDGTKRTGTRNLVRSTNVSYVDIVGTNGKYCRFDDFKIKL